MTKLILSWGKAGEGKLTYKRAKRLGEGGTQTFDENNDSINFIALQVLLY